MKNNKIKKNVDLIIGGKPTKKQSYESVSSAYEKKANKVLRSKYGNTYDLVFDGKTMDAFLDYKNMDILVGIKGTSLNPKDLLADINLVISKLKDSDRFMDDIKQFQKILKKYPKDKYDYYLASHSLGSAISNEFMRIFPFIDSAINFNGALQPKLDSKNPDNIEYEYINKDFLYNSFGRLLENKKNVNKYPYKKIRSKKFFDKFIPVTIKAHSLDQFKGIYL